MNFVINPHPEAEKISALIAQGKQDNPEKRPRDLAGSLGLSEGLMVSSGCGGDVTRLVPGCKAMLKAFEDLGEVMVLTRNESCVHEKVGSYGRIGGGEHVAIVLNKDVDLRVFLNQWVHVFALREQTAKGLKRSIQVFNQEGEAVHKIHLRDASNLAAFDALVDGFRHDNQTPFFLPEAAKEQASTGELSDNEVDVAALRADWQAMTDVHQFFGMLKKHNVSRQQAHRLVGQSFAYQLDNGSVRAALTAAADMQLPIMVFVSSPGCVQIHSGPIETLKTVGPWFNILDPGFNLHLREDHIHSVWLVRKPNAFGHVTSVEVYDQNQDMIVQFYGVRDEKEDENPEWRALAENLPQLPVSKEIVQ